MAATSDDRSICKVMHDEVKPALVMVVVQALFAGVNVAYKIAYAAGMNAAVLTFYRFLFAAGFIAPIAFIAERIAIGMNLSVEIVIYSSATFSAAIANLDPAITFIIAVILRSDEEVVDQKKLIEESSCKPKCVRQLREYQACAKRVEGDESGHKHCTGQYFDYWQCIDKCVAPKLFAKLK
nr:cytochrome B-C1 complex subunit 6-like [Ipomoea batatas]